MMQRPHKAYPVELAQFHSADYVDFLHRITPDTQRLFSNELVKCTTLSTNLPMNSSHYSLSLECQWYGSDNCLKCFNVLLDDIF